MKIERFFFLSLLLVFSCSKVSKRNTTEENIKYINTENVMEYDFREAIDIYDIPRFAFKYDNLEKGDSIAGFPKSISKFIPVGRKVKILDAIWINKSKNEEIQVWYTKDRKGLWNPFNAEQRKISAYFLEN